MQLIQSQVSGALVEQLAGEMGGNKDQTSPAVKGAMSMLMGALANNASTPQGANALAGALEKDHDGSILEDVMGFIGGQKQASNSRMLNGAGILKHVLGQRQETAVDMLSQQSGMDKSQMFSLLVKVAPVVMGMLGKVKKEQNLDQGGLSNLLRSANQDIAKPSSGLGMGDMFTSLLDRDGDGSIVDDVAQSGFKALFGKLFGRK